MTPFRQAVLAACSRIPRGRVATYAALAAAIGNPGAARAVGNALNGNPCAPRVPCHRVVKSDGSVGGYAGGARRKIALLRAEGVAVRSGRTAAGEALRRIPR